LVIMAAPEVTHEAVEENFQTEAEPSFDELKQGIRANLLALAERDTLLLSTGKKTGEMLDEAGSHLAQLKKKYPNDPDIYVFEQIYTDLREDFELGRETDIDSSMDTILAEMGEIVDSADVRRESPDETILADTIEDLRDLGIDPAYVITQGDPEAPTVLLYMQLHPSHKMSEDIRLSQAQIQRELRGLIEKGLSDTVYVEGLQTGGELGEFLEKGEVTRTGEDADAVTRLKQEFGDRFDAIGYENLPLLRSVMRGGIESQKAARQWMYRATAHNAVLASNVSGDVIKNNKDLVCMVIGAGHEDPEFWRREEHPLPISEMLAYYGLNIIVVDAAMKYFQPDKELRETIDRVASQF